MSVDALFIAASPITLHAVAGLVTGVELAGVDGLILLATIVVLAFVFALSGGAHQNALTPKRDKLLNTQAEEVSATPIYADVVPDAQPSTTFDDVTIPEVASQPIPHQPVWARLAPQRVPDRFANLLRLRSVMGAASALIIGLTLVWIGQNKLLGADPGSGAYTVWLFGLVLLAFVIDQSDLFQKASPSAVAVDVSERLWGVRGAMLIGVGIASLYIWQEAGDRPVSDASLDLVVLWLGSIAALVVAATGMPQRADAARLRAWVRRVRVDLLITVVVALVALIPRVYDLSSFPWSMSGDEGTFAVTARTVLRGELSNPFWSGPWGYPSLIFILQGWLIELTSETVGGARMLSALLGTASVVAIYWLARHHFGQWVGLAAAAISASFHFHLFWSRNAQNAIAPMLFTPLTLLLLDRGLVERRRTDSLAAGLVIALAQFFHPANRILFPIAAVYVVYALFLQRSESRAGIIPIFRATAPNVFWLAAGAIVGHLPLLSYFSTHRTEFSSRTNQISVFASGWLEREQEITGKGAIEILRSQFQNTALLPFNTFPHGHFHPGVPFSWWPMVVPLAIGMAIVTLTFWRQRSFGLAMAFWATVVGMALTEGPPQTNRYTSAGPFLAIFAAIGIVAVARVAIRLLRAPKWPVAALVGVVTLLIAWWHLSWYFDDSNPAAASSDTSSQIANYLARDAEFYGDGLVVYFSGAPRLIFSGFSNISYIAPSAVGIDVKDPWTATGPPPDLTGPTLSGFKPERLGELNVVRAWFPNGTMQVFTLPNGEEILTTYFVDAPIVEPARAVVNAPDETN